MALCLRDAVVFGAGDIAVIAESHGYEIIVLVNHATVLRGIITPAGHLACAGGIGKAFAAAHLVKQPTAACEAAQPIDGNVWAGGDVALHADSWVKLHNGARDNAVECLYGWHLPEHGLVIHAVINIDTAECCAVGQVDVLALV